MTWAIPSGLLPFVAPKADCKSALHPCGHRVWRPGWNRPGVRPPTATVWLVSGALMVRASSAMAAWANGKMKRQQAESQVRFEFIRVEGDARGAACLCASLQTSTLIWVEFLKDFFSGLFEIHLETREHA